MRVTNNIITARSRLHLQQGLQHVDRLRDDIATGVRLRTLSDNATSGSELVRIGGSMRAITQFRRNATIGIARAEAEENALNQLTNVLTRAVELGISQSSGTANASSRLITKHEVDQLISLATSLGNTRFAGQFLFGGNRGSEPPLHSPIPVSGSASALTDVSGNPVNPSGSLSLEIGDGRFIVPTHNATEVFLDTDTLAALRALSDALGANDPNAIRLATGRMNAANDNVQALVGTLGARVNEMQDAKNNLDALELTLQTYRADLRDTEIDKAMVDLVGKQTLYQAAMSATSRILGLSLANYL